MRKGNYTIEPRRITIRPHFKTGWETVLDQMEQQINMQLKVLGLRLPLKRRSSFTQVVRLGKVYKQAWWSYGILGQVSSVNPLDIIQTLWEILDIRKAHMPLRGVRYEILLT